MTLGPLFVVNQTRGITFSEGVYMAPIPREYHVDRNGTVFIQCQASYDASNLDLVYVWKFNGKLIDFERDTLLKKVWTLNYQKL